MVISESSWRPFKHVDPKCKANLASLDPPKEVISWWDYGKFCVPSLLAFGNNFYLSRLALAGQILAPASGCYNCFLLLYLFYFKPNVALNKAYNSITKQEFVELTPKKDYNVMYGREQSMSKKERERAGKKLDRG